MNVYIYSMYKEIILLFLLIQSKCFPDSDWWCIKPCMWNISNNKDDDFSASVFIHIEDQVPQGKLNKEYSYEKVWPTNAEEFQKLWKNHL